VTVGCLCVDWHRPASAWADLLTKVEGPKHSSTKHEGLIVDNVLAQTRAAAEAERVHGLALAEVGIAGEGLLIGWPTRLKPTLGPEVVAIGIFGWDTVQSPVEWVLVGN